MSKDILKDSAIRVN